MAVLHFFLVNSSLYILFSMVISYPYIPESKSSHLAKYKYFKGKDPKEKVNFTTVKTRVKTCMEKCTRSSLKPTE